MNENDRRPEHEGCLGHSVPVKIHTQNRFMWENDGEVAALDPRKKVGDWQQPKGLYLATADYIPDILSVTTTDGKDVTEYVRMARDARIEITPRYNLIRLHK